MEVLNQTRLQAYKAGWDQCNPQGAGRSWGEENLPWSRDKTGARVCNTAALLSHSYSYFFSQKKKEKNEAMPKRDLDSPCVGKQRADWSL